MLDNELTYCLIHGLINRLLNFCWSTTHFILFAKSMWNTQRVDLNLSILNASICVDCDVISIYVIAEYLTFLSTYNIRASLWKSDERKILGSSSNDIVPGRNFVNYFHTCRSVVTPWQQTYFLDAPIEWMTRLNSDRIMWRKYIFITPPISCI